MEVQQSMVQHSMSSLNLAAGAGLKIVSADWPPPREQSSSASAP